MVGAITITYNNDRSGAQSAMEDSQELHALGYKAVSSGVTGSHTNLRRTAVNAVAAVGMGRALGVGIFKTSKNPGKMRVTYQKWAGQYSQPQSLGPMGMVCFAFRGVE